MKQGVAYLKNRRKDSQKASILRFLSLQKRAFSALIRFTIEHQEYKIKKDFAMQLYYKRLLDKTLASLRVYKTYKARVRKEREEAREAKKAEATERQRSVSAEIQRDFEAYTASKLTSRKSEAQPTEQSNRSQRSS